MANNMSHTIIRGRTYYTNFRLNDSTRFIRVSPGTDSLKQAEMLMDQVRPFIPVVQNGTMSVEVFKLRLQGFRDATKKDFDEYLLNWLRGGLEEANRLPVFVDHYKRRVHSLRHTFISNAIDTVGNSALVQFVVGHSRTQSLGITARYMHTPPLKDLLPVIDCIH